MHTCHFTLAERMCISDRGYTHYKPERIIISQDLKGVFSPPLQKKLISSI